MCLYYLITHTHTHTYIYCIIWQQIITKVYFVDVGWLFGFYGISTFVGYLMSFYTNNQFYFKQFSLAWVHSLIIKNISISSYSV